MTKQRNSKGRFLPGHTVNAKPDDKRAIHVHITLYPHQVDYLDSLNVSRSQAVRDILDKWRNLQQPNATL